MNFYATEKKHKRYWKERKIDWKTQYLDTWNHPHRYFLTAILKSFFWISLMEVGCGPGPNLVNIVKNLKGKQVGGVDINADAIALAEKTFNGGMFKVGTGDNLMMSDNSTDVLLTDMALIYVKHIDKYISEFKRVTRGGGHVVLCEFDSKSWWKRFKLWVGTGYYAYDYKKVLQKHGFYDIIKYKIPREVWDGYPQTDYGYVIVATVPKRG